MSHATESSGPYGLLAEFNSAQDLLDAAHAVRRAGYTKTDAFSPAPIHGLAEALGFEESIIPKVVLGAGITGLIAGYGLEYWSQVIAWPQNIGGRPYHSWVAFIPPAYETTILFAALSCFGTLLVLCGLPKSASAARCRGRARRRRARAHARASRTKVPLARRSRSWWTPRPAPWQ